MKMGLRCLAWAVNMKMVNVSHLRTELGRKLYREPGYTLLVNNLKGFNIAALNCLRRWRGPIYGISNEFDGGLDNEKALMDTGARLVI